MGQVKMSKLFWLIFGLCVWLTNTKSPEVQVWSEAFDLAHPEDRIRPLQSELAVAKGAEASKKETKKEDKKESTSNKEEESKKAEEGKEKKEASKPKEKSSKTKDKSKEDN